MQHIVILAHLTDQFAKSNYFLKKVAEVWRSSGFQVSVLRGAQNWIQADLAILHVNLTVVPEEYLELAKRYPVVVNGSVETISKDSFSALRVKRAQDFSGPVIVKTNLNCNGIKEAALASDGSWLRRWAQSFFRRFFWSHPAAIGMPGYRIFESTAKVPRRVWDHPGLIVEKFTPETRDGFYFLRTWVFLGDRETHSLCYSKEPIVKGNNVLGRELLGEVPEELRRIRKELGFDFGKFDYALVDGRVVLYDVNHTPSLGGMSRDVLEPGMRHLAQGIQSLLPSKKAPPTGHWTAIASSWKQVGPPLRPSPADLEFLSQEVGDWSNLHGAPRALILGVTPELYHLPWPAATDLKAVDRNQAMIDALWPGRPQDVLRADWTSIPLEPGTRDILLCDGGVHLLSYPQGQRALASCLREVVAPGGLCLLRLFIPPREREPAQVVLQDLLAGRVANLNILKLRLGMALQEGVEQGVQLGKVWEALHSAAPDFEALAERIHWPLEHLRAINSYRDSQDKYYFIGLEEARALFCGEPGGFSLEKIYEPDYLLGARCPTVVLRRMGA